MSIDFTDYLARYQQRNEQVLQRQLARLELLAPRLNEAMSYSLIGNGKRIRPVLAYASAQAVAEISPAVDAVGCALECVHTYSLIHDDLPAMDDDDLRRGRPTCHIAFDEATAILAGDALLTLAFQILADIPDCKPQTIVSLVRELATASGASGMVGGQALDLAAVSQQPELAEVEIMHRHKTGALIRASVAMGALATESATELQLQSLDEYAAAIGLAFQVQDDILDATGDEAAMGKRQGADALRDKPTYVSLLGLDGARQKAQELHAQALQALEDFDERAAPLRALSAFIVERSN